MKESIRQSFEDQLRVCIKQTTHLVIQRQIWQDLVEMARSNDWVREPPALFQFITNCYYDSLAVGIRRLFDNHGDAMSVRRLLRRVASGEVRFTKSWFIERWPGTSQDRTMREIAARTWDRLAGEGRLAIDGVRVDEQLAQITGAADDVLAYVSQRIAHHDPREDPSPPPFARVDTALEVAIKLQNDYYLLTTGGSIDLANVTFQYNWKRPLYFPWTMASRYHVGLQMPVHAEGGGPPDYWSGVEQIRQRNRTHAT